MTDLTCFKSYDIRGQLGRDLDADICYRIGRAFVAVIDPGTVVVGRDARESSPELCDALARGLRDSGAHVIDIGSCGTEEVYFATSHFEAGGGLMVTASHNPIDYNGIKLVKAGSRPISAAEGLNEIKALAEANTFPEAEPGVIEARDPRADYVEKVLSFVDQSALKPLKILVNAGNGQAGPSFDAIARGLSGTPLEFVRMHHDPDSSFPNGIPNPLLPENQPVTAQALRDCGADFAVAWDGDFDRCFFFDETGRFIDGEYIVGLLAAAFLAKESGAKIVHDPRVMWNTVDIVAENGGEAVVSLTGHALIKAKMREVDAVYGGEMSAHHYFRNFMYCDSGMIPWLLVAELVSRSGKPLSSLVSDRMAKFPSSGERNFRLADPQAAIDAFEAEYLEGASLHDRLDGISVAYADWRANLRRSNTEPVVRLNVETRGDAVLCAEKTAEISALLERAGG
ncbi:phosphomannomutase [Alphaproteobacteria bacterium KMM 3653]|uniref:Phosphomannomutase n=1 Tax=Harenicola maris TaxID=2841044 RepID=A0AAP2CM74_9RHOB|nr:phosphomannomutase [Harenicola maris]